MDAISDGRQFFQARGISFAELAVKWQHNDTSSVFSDRLHDGAAYSTATNVMWLDGVSDKPDSDDSNKRFTVLHEMGHHIMNAAGRFPASRTCPSPHYLQRPSTANCAWYEGWANFVPQMVDNNAVVRWTKNIYVDLEQDELENRSSGVPTRFARTDASGNDAGHLVEGQVAAALWDIKDSDVDGRFDREGHAARGRALDDLAMGDNEIVAVFRASTYEDFSSFRDAWEAAQPLSSADNVMRLHAMGFVPAGGGGGGSHSPLLEFFDRFIRWLISGNWALGAPAEGGQPPGHPPATRWQRRAPASRSAC